MNSKVVMSTDLDIEEMRRKHKEFMESFAELERLQKSNAELKERISRPSAHKPLGLIDSIIVMGCFLFVGLLFIIFIAAIFL